MAFRMSTSSRTVVPSTRSRVRNGRKIHTSVQTIFNPTAEAVETLVAKGPASLAGSATLFLLHPESPRQIITTIMELLKTNRPNAIGSYAISNLPSSSPSPSPPPSFSMATFAPTSPSERITAFRADIRSRPPVSVGKATHKGPLDRQGGGSGNARTGGWTASAGGSSSRSIGQKADFAAELEKAMAGNGVGGWGELWEGSQSGARDGPSGLPEGMKSLQNVQSMLLLSDGNPTNLISTLSTSFPLSSVLGLLTSPTPFATGRPFTLIQNGQAFEDGAVGIAFSGIEPKELVVDRVWEGLEVLGPVERISDCEGNMLISLHSATTSNPAQALIKAINAAASLSTAGLKPSEGKTAAAGISLGKMNKELEFFVALLDEDEGQKLPAQIIRIISGDPARGALSLDMLESLRVGQKIQFMRKTPGVIPSHQTYRSNSISFTTISADEDSPYEVPMAKIHASETVEGISIGTEGGFFYAAADGGRKRTNVGVCKVPGARGSIQFRSK